MHTTYRAVIKPFNLKELLQHVANQYSEHLDAIGNNDLIPACALEDKGTVYLIGLPDKLAIEVFQEFFNNKNIAVEIKGNRISICRELLDFARLSSVDQHQLLFMLNKKLKQEQSNINNNTVSHVHR